MDCEVRVLLVMLFPGRFHSLAKAGLKRPRYFLIGCPTGPLRTINGKHEIEEKHSNVPHK